MIKYPFEARVKRCLGKKSNATLIILFTLIGYLCINNNVLMYYHVTNSHFIDKKQNFTREKIIIDIEDILVANLSVNSQDFIILKEEFFSGFQKDAKRNCIRPKINPYNPEIMKFVSKEKQIKCNPNENWVYVDQGLVRFSNRASAKYGPFTCGMTLLLRDDDFQVKDGSRVFPINDGMPLISDFFKIDCRSQKDGIIYSNIHSGIAYDSTLQARPIFNKLSKNALGYNVFVLGFDSVSRMSWMRMLPKTYEYIVKELGAIILKGYNIVGDGTPQALLPILTGLKETELPEARRGFKNANYVDSFPWIWKKFKQNGYVTQWAEDMQSIGTFQLRMLGFKEQPVDHYMRSFYLEAEKYYSRFRRLCFGSLPRHENIFNWAKEFFLMYKTQPKFSFIFHSETSHNYNNPLNLIDDDLKKFLMEFKERGFMDNTIIILMSDHGVRVSDLRQFTQGKLEERLPFMSFILPKKFHKMYPHQVNNLRLNTRVLTTPFDIHETLLDLLDFNRKHNHTSRGMSLFSRIPLSRSCNDAHIEPHWCSCLSWLSLDITNHSSSMKIAQEAVFFINSLINQDFKDICEELKLKSIEQLSKLDLNKELLDFQKSKDVHGREALFNTNHTKQNTDTIYQITIVTQPGLAIYELSLKYNEISNKFKFNKNDISRINSYNTTSNCIVNIRPDLRQFCFCKSQTYN